MKSKPQRSASERPALTRPTMHDVAAKAGVSQMTVSRVLRNDGYVSEDVKQRVSEAVVQLGYIHNRLASTQRGVENPMVGVILPTLKNSVFTDVLAGINDSLAQQSMRPVFGVSEYSQQEEEKLVRDMLSWQPCGLILSGLEHTENLLRLIEKSKLRVAEIMDVEGKAIAASFGISHQSAGAHMARHFLDRGFRNVAYLGAHGGQDLRAVKRLDAFRATLEAGGARVVHQSISDNPSSMLLGRELTRACLSGAGKPDAIYYSNDDLAAGGLMHCLAEGIDVPAQLALAGFNGLPFLDALPLRITTTNTPRYEIGSRAAVYVAGASHEADGVHAIPAELVIGDTT